ncbi:hypothetical protein G9A89_019663 [Geosiphon pyriformis]|nr:hypothetical protein G9A89_019663 [Geosiphon pyriformis]
MLSKSKIRLDTIPLNLFQEICKFLSGDDLLVLSQVNKAFQKILCNEDESPLFEAIWKENRLNFLPHLKLPPPPNLNEKVYVNLGRLDRGCQFCQKSEGVKIHWEFQQKIYGKDSPEVKAIREICKILPHQYSPKSNDKRWWIPDINSAKFELEKLKSKNQFELWKLLRLLNSSDRMIDVAYRSLEADERNFDNEINFGESLSGNKSIDKKQGAENQSLNEQKAQKNRSIELKIMQIHHYKRMKIHTLKRIQDLF